MTEENWKLEKDLCRCCHNEGAFKNLAEPFCNQGEEEIYSEMLIKCLDINLTPVAGPLCTVTYTICEGCVLRLRDACSFKRQVLQCEQRFQDLYSKNVIKLDTCYDIDIKVEAPDIINEELKEEDNLDDDVTNDNGCDDYHSDLDLAKEDNKTVKTKKPKEKMKKKKAGRPRKVKPELEGDTDGREKRKRGDVGLNETYTIIENGGETRYECVVCERAYANHHLFTQHYRHVHLKLRPKLRSCYLCEVRVPGHLRTKHMEEAHGVPRPQCNACGKKFAFPFQVISHQKRYHMDEKMYPCTKCDMKFTIPSKLAQHSLKHSSVRPHKCEYCEKAFKWKKNLTTHIMMHLDERRHVCKACSEAFVQQTSLKYHMAKRHPEIV